MFFLTGEKTADYVGLAFKENVKNERIHFFYIILLCYRILQDCEGVKDATEILFLKCIDRPVKGAETKSLSTIHW